MNRVRALVLAAGLLVPGAAAAQVADTLLQRGVAAYQELDYATATRLLEQAVTIAERTDATATQVNALTYLGATQVFRGQPDSAAARFRRSLLLDPRHRIDALIFPPEVTLVFETVREEIKVVALEVPGDTVVPTFDGTLTARLVPTTPHEVTVDIRAGASARTDTLYRGPVRDSLEIAWDLRLADGQPVRNDLYVLSVRSEPSADGVTRVATVLLDIERIRPDTVPHPRPPADSAYLPESEPRPRGLKAIPLGVAAAAAVAVIPAAVAPESNLTEARFVVAGAITFASLARLFDPPPGQPIPANIEANAERRRQWESRRQAVIRQNASRRTGDRLVIRAGPPTISPTLRP